MNRGDARAAGGLFLLLLSLALLASHYGPVSNDEILYFHMARSIALRGAADVPPFEMLEVRRGADGRAYAPYPPGFPALLAPAVRAGRRLAAATERAPDSFGARTAEIRVVFVWSAVLAAAAGTVPFLVLRALGAGGAAALGAALAIALGTPSSYYARTLFSEPVRTGLAVAAAIPLARLSRGGGAAAAATAGSLLAAAALVRVDSLFLWPAGLLGVLLAARGRPTPARAVAGFLAPPAAAAALLLAYNRHRYGAFLSTGYEHQLPGMGHMVEGVLAVLAAPGRGLLVFGPVALLGLAGLRGLARLDRPAAVYAAAAAILSLLGTSSTGAWRICWDWGPRYLHTAWTLAGLGLAFLPDRPAWRRSAAALAAWGLAVNLLGAASDFTRHYAAVGDVARVLYDPAAWPVAAQARAIAAGRIDLPVLRTPLLAAGLLAATALGARRAVDAARRRP